MDLTEFLDESLPLILDRLSVGEFDAELQEPDSQLYRFLVERTVQEVRSGTREDLLAGALTFSQLGLRKASERKRAGGTNGRDTLPKRSPGQTAALTQLEVIGDVLHAAATRTDDSAIPVILRSFSGKAEKALRLLANRQAAALNGAGAGTLTATPQSELAVVLGMSASNVSHLVGDLVRTGLIERVKKGQRVFLSLTHAGFGYVNERASELGPI